MVEALQKKIINLTEKYVDLMEKQIDSAMSSTEKIDYEKIYEGIRVLNHISTALYRVGACEKEHCQTPCNIQENSHS